MRSPRQSVTLALCLALSLAAIALPARHTQAQQPVQTTYQILDIYHATILVNGAPAQLGVNYGPNDTVVVAATALDGEFTVQETQNGVPLIKSFAASNYLSPIRFQAIWTGDEHL
jgi:hypothetical protein